jgi:hypothetical protein
MRVNSKYLSQHYEEEARYSVYLLFWYKSTNTDAEGSAPRASKKLVPISAAAGRMHVAENAHKLNVGYTNGAGFHNGTTTGQGIIKKKRFSLASLEHAFICLCLIYMPYLCLI